MSISVIWRRNTCLWVGFSSRTRKMTLEHRLLHRNRNKMKIWKCMVLRPNALKSSHFSHSKCYKNHVYEGNYLNLGHTFLRVSYSTPVCKTWQVSTRSRRGRGAVSTQKFGAVFKNLGQSQTFWGRYRRPGQQHNGSGAAGSGAGRRGGDRKERGKERREGLFSRSAAK